RGGGSTVVRAVTSGFIPGDDWADEYEAMTAGGDGYFRTLVEYLTHFSGRYAVPVTAFGPGARPGAGWERDRALLCAALGLPRGAAPGDLARFTAAETGRPVEAIVYHATGNVIGVRAPGAFYRFLRGFGHPMVAAHLLFSEDTDPGQAAPAWESWLARVLDPAS
ncbi:MAG TPA: SRPBCC domain-containing protein, partial [Streptosporangiaceae bacterium]|nr:SRPBCC domain-containing protein [Streptosporangiaceae bacterium]